MTSPKNALFSTERHPVVSPSMTAFLIIPSIAFHLAESVLPVWALTAVRRAFLLFLTLAPSTGKADRRKPNTLGGLLLDRKPVHFCRQRSQWSDAEPASQSGDVDSPYLSAQFADQPNQKFRRSFEFDQRNVLITAMGNAHISRAKALRRAH
jgi:hypothetical protein